MILTAKHWGLAFAIQRSIKMTMQDREHLLADFIEFVNSDREKMTIIGSVRLYGYVYGCSNANGKTFRKDGDFFHSTNIETIEKADDNYIITTITDNQIIVNKADYNRDMARMLDDFKKGKLSELIGSYLFNYEKNDRKLYL